MIINCDSIVARSFNEMPFHFCVIDEKSYFYINFMILGISMQLKSGEPLGGGAAPFSTLFLHEFDFLAIVSNARVNPLSSIQNNCAIVENKLCGNGFLIDIIAG